MDIKVIQVEVKESPQYGKRKVLHVDDGSKWNVSSKKPFYDDVVGPGIYSVSIKQFNGKDYISYLSFKGAIQGQTAAVAGFSTPVGVPTPENVKAAVAGVNAENNALQMRLEADKKRQDDIRLEFYCGLAKDIAIANKKDGVDISPLSVVACGYTMYNRHLSLLKGKETPSEEAAEQEKGKTTEEVEEPPF